MLLYSFIVTPNSGTKVNKCGAFMETKSNPLPQGKFYAKVFRGEEICDTLGGGR